MDSRSDRSAILKVFAILLIPAILTGCNTIAGLGEDTQAAGEALEEEAEGVE